MDTPLPLEIGNLPDETARRTRKRPTRRASVGANTLRWSIDAATREAGRQGIARARQALQRAHQQHDAPRHGASEPVSQSRQDAA